MKTAVVILNWNGKKLLEEFLPSVVRYASEATVYVADNASTDDSISFLQNEFPQVKIIQNKTNGGYAKGYNDALRLLNEEYVVLLNNDVQVSEGWLTPCVKAFEDEANLVALQPKILDYKNPAFFEYAGAAGGFIDRLGYPYCQGRIFNTLEKDEGQFDENTKIFWASGACLFIKREAFWKAGGFDEELFAHQEEIDLCWRLQSQGGVIKYIHNSKVFHLGGGTLSSSNPKKTFYNFRNSLLILYKNTAGNFVYLRLFERMLWDGVAGIHFLLNGKFSHFVAILKAHLSFYQLLPSFYTKRKSDQSKLTYWKTKSVVWQYFFLKNRTFNKLK